MRVEKCAIEIRTFCASYFWRIFTTPFWWNVVLPVNSWLPPTGDEGSVRHDMCMNLAFSQVWIAIGPSNWPLKISKLRVKL